MPRPNTPLLAVALVASMAACGAPPPPPPDPEPEPTVLEGVYVGDPTYLPMAIAMTAYGEALLPLAVGGAVASSQVELLPGYWVVGSGLVGQDGEVSVELLDGDELPAGALVSAALAFQTSYGGEVPAGCAITPDDTEARVTAFGAGGSLLAPALLGFTPEGIASVALTPNVIDLTDPGLSAFTLIGYVYADRPVAFASSGTCTDAAQDLTVAVALDTGWNRVAYRFSDLPPPAVSVVMENDAGTALRVQALQ